MQTKAQLLEQQVGKGSQLQGHATHEGAMKNHLSTKITAKQHAGGFKEDVYADGNLLFFLHLLPRSIRP